MVADRNAREWAGVLEPGGGTRDVCAAGGGEANASVLLLGCAAGGGCASSTVGCGIDDGTDDGGASLAFNPAALGGTATSTVEDSDAGEADLSLGSCVDIGTTAFAPTGCRAGDVGLSLCCCVPAGGAVNLSAAGCGIVLHATPVVGSVSSCAIVQLKPLRVWTHSFEALLLTS